MNPKTHKLFALSSPISSPFSTPPGSRDGVRPTFKGGRLCREEFPRCRGGARAGATLEMFFDGFLGLGFSGAIYITLSDTSYLFHNI